MNQPLRISLLTVGLASLFSSLASADVKLPNIFGDHMVLQYGQRNKVWGTAEPGEKVRVQIANQLHEATADGEGNWSVYLDALPLGDPITMTVQGKNTIEFQDILVGEVWICSGQSNMQWIVNDSNDADLEKLAAKYPKIRMINFPKVGSQESIWTHDSPWQVCSPESVGNFSAVGYFFARQLQETIDRPIGMINNAWGGSACEAWIDRNLLKENESFAPLLASWSEKEKAFVELTARTELNDEEKKKLEQLQREMKGNHRPGNIYHGVLKSHLGYGIKGAIWYQGESNAGRAYQYRTLFPLMIQSWRDEWKQGDFPFYWVQLADYLAESSTPKESNWAELREAQTMAMKALPNTGQAVIIDIGEGKDIHPKNKVDVGRRLARWALANEYQVAVPYRSPMWKSMVVEENKAYLTFDHVDVKNAKGSGWRPFDTNEPRGFAIAGEDKQFVWAQAKIEADDRVVVWHDSVPHPVSVRYGWADNPVCNMYSLSGLPLTPFRTDDWPGQTSGVKR